MGLFYCSQAFFIVVIIIIMLRTLKEYYDDIDEVACFL